MQDNGAADQGPRTTLGHAKCGIDCGVIGVGSEQYLGNMVVAAVRRCVVP